MLRETILKTAASARTRRFVERTPVTRSVVDRFVAGVTDADAVTASRRLVERGCAVTLDYLGEDTTDLGQAKSVVTQYLSLLDRLTETALADRVEMSVKLSALGQAFPFDGEAIALDHAQEICAAAKAAGTMVTVDMEDHTTTDSTLQIVRALREDFPSTGAVIQAYLRRSLEDCSDLGYAGSRVRLCKGAYREPATVAYQGRDEIRDSYVQCAQALMAGGATALLATHDPEMVVQGKRLATEQGLDLGDYEFQMLYGVRPLEQKRLADQGHVVRVYVPFGEEWYGYLVRRMAERPANLALFLRSLTSKN